MKYSNANSIVFYSFPWQSHIQIIRSTEISKSDKVELVTGKKKRDLQKKTNKKTNIKTSKQNKQTKKHQKMTEGYIK